MKTGIFGPKPTSFRTSAILYYTILYYAIQYILYKTKFAKSKKSNHPTVLTYSGREWGRVYAYCGGVRGSVVGCVQYLLW